MTPIDSMHFVVGTLFGVASGFLIGGSLVMFFGVKPLQGIVKSLTQKLDEEKHQLGLWKNRAFYQTEKAQQWFVAFRSMIETASGVSVDGEEFDTAHLTLVRGTNEGDVVLFELKSGQRGVVIKFVPRFSVLSGIGTVISVDESCWSDDSPDKTRMDTLRDRCIDYLNIPPLVSKGAEGEGYKPNFRAE